MTNKNDLFEIALEQDTIELPRANGKSVTVTVRALTRGEFFRHRGKNLSVPQMERKLLALAMVEPEMSEDDIALWQDASRAQEIETVMKAVMILSGFGDDDMEAAQRAAYKSAGE